MPEVEWLHRWEQPENADIDKNEVANMDKLDYEVLLAEIEHR